MDQKKLATDNHKQTAPPPVKNDSSLIILYPAPLSEVVWCYDPPQISITTPMVIITDSPLVILVKQGDNILSVYLTSHGLTVWTLTLIFVCRSTLTLAKLPWIVFWHRCSCYLALTSKVRVKVKGWSQGHRSRSNFWHAAVNIRGSALPSAAKSKEVIISPKCVYVCLIIAWTWPIGF